MRDHNDLEQLTLWEEEQRQELVGMVWNYTLALERYVVRLRGEVNDLAELLNRNRPYPDPESDFAVRFFSDHPAYEEYKEVLSVDETDWKLVD